MGRAKKSIETQQDSLVKRLDAMMNVLLSLPGYDGKTLSTLRRVEILRTSGLRNVEIASILGVSQPAVGVMLDRLRKKVKKHSDKS